MAKETGLGIATLSLDDSTPTLRVIKNDVLSFDFATPHAPQDVTGLDKSAIERLLTLADLQVNLSGVFNDGSNAAHDVLKTAASSSVQRTFSIDVSGQTMTP